MSGKAIRSDLFRAWSSHAAREALEAGQPIARARCSHSAAMWGLIASAIEGGDEARISVLTHNLVLLPAGPFHHAN